MISEEPITPMSSDARGRLSLAQPHTPYAISYVGDTFVGIPVSVAFKGGPTTLENIREAMQRALLQLEVGPPLGIGSRGQIIDMEVRGRFLITGSHHCELASLLASKYTAGPVFWDHGDLSDYNSYREDFHIEMSEKFENSNADAISFENDVHVHQEMSKYTYSDLSKDELDKIEESIRRTLVNDPEPPLDAFPPALFVGGDPDPEWLSADFDTELEERLGISREQSLSSQASFLLRANGSKSKFVPEIRYNPSTHTFSTAPSTFLPYGRGYQVVHGLTARDEVVETAVEHNYTRIEANRIDGFTLTSARYPDGIFVRRDMAKLAETMRDVPGQSTRTDTSTDHATGDEE